VETWAFILLLKPCRVETWAKMHTIQGRHKQ
jgi:hypothetical protein